MQTSLRTSLQQFAASNWVLFLVLLLWAVILTYPLVLHPFSHIPLGDEPAGTVPLFNLWTLQWNIDQLTQGYPHYWNAPIFAPYTGTFAFSEIQPLTALIAAPVWLAFQSPPLGYNFVVILFLLLNGWFAFWLLRNWGAGRLAALLTGLITQSLPFVAQEMGVLQLTAIFGLLWLLFFGSRFLQQPNGSNLFGFALGFPVTFFTCGYYGLFSLLFLPLFILFHLQKKHLNMRMLRQCLMVGLIVLALTGPLLWSQQQQLARYGFSRSETTIENNSAKLAHYANYLDHNLLYSQILQRPSPPGQRLFPGLALIILAAFGLFSQTPNRIKGYLLVAGLAALLLSLGLRLHIGDIRPYQWIREFVPGFQQLRSPFRFAAFVQIHLALLAGLGLSTLERQQFRGRIILIIIAALFVVIESLALPMPLQATPQPQHEAAWQTWLAQQPASTNVIMLPFAAGTTVFDFENTIQWMLAGRTGPVRLVNGYSGFFPRDHARVRAVMNQFPSTDSIDLLRDMQVDYVIIHHHLPNAPSPKLASHRLPLVFQDRHWGVSVFAVP